MKLLQKILIANRGEIAIRIIRTARKLGIATVAIYSKHDEGALHTTLADEAWDLGDGNLAATYLNIQAIIGICKSAGCDAVHPGYGFLSENPLFAQACHEAGIIFIGPSAGIIQMMGNKIAARNIARKAGLPVGEGVTGTPEELLSKAAGLPYPVLIKAAAGGGGKGMRIVRNAEELPSLLESTSREAASYFGDGSVYIERFVEEPRHIEVQVLGDGKGNAVHFFERECSIQRRYQKIVEESPSPTLTPAVREKICRAAVDLTASIGYGSAGTIEFLVDKDLNFFFLEMNTRIQVEHPVTEMVTGVDLVEEQILIASGQPLRHTQDQIKQNGHAIECRIYAEDPAAGFMPSPGKMTLFHAPEGRYIRLDTAYAKAGTVNSAFDPMIAKLVTWGNDRNIAQARMAGALSDFTIQGIKTNIPYLAALIRHEAYLANAISTKFCDLYTDALNHEIEASRLKAGITIPALGYLLHSFGIHHEAANRNIWETIGYWRNLSCLQVAVDQQAVKIELVKRQQNTFEFAIDGNHFTCVIRETGPNRLVFASGGHSYTCLASDDQKGHTYLNLNGFTYTCSRTDLLFTPEVFSMTEHSNHAAGGRISAPMPGKVIKINVSVGQEVEKGQVLLVIESMKMENNILSTVTGTITSVNIKPGDMADTEMVLMEVEEKKEEQKK